MLKIIMLGLVLAAVVLSGTMSVADAADNPLVDKIPTIEKIPSPLQQMRNGVPADEVVCSYGRILVTSPSGAPACVFAGSVEVLERRRFVLPSEMPLDDLLPKRPKASEKAGITSSPDASKTGDRPFVTTWRTTSPNEWIIVPVGGATGVYTVDWGDGRTTANVTGNQIHSYKKAGTYTVAITGNFERIYLNGHAFNPPSKLSSIEQWGDIKWSSMGSAFKGARNMIYNADDIPDLSGVTDISYMFHNTRSFNGDLSAWDVSGVTDMSGMFHNTGSFNGDLSAWDVSNVRDMAWMFYYASSFDGDISAWDVSGVTDMSYMFHNTGSFNGDLSAWNVSNVRDTAWMFSHASSFDGDIHAWDVSGVTDMNHMFSDTSPFNGDLSAWDVSNVTNMGGMFADTSHFNGDLSSWDVSGVTDMSDMFASASFNGNLSAWDVSNVNYMNNMFSESTSFNGDISAWDVSGVTNMSHMFARTHLFSSDLSGWDVSSVTDMSNMFTLTTFNGNLSAWDVSSVTAMANMFKYASSFNSDISGWDVSSVRDMRGMFNYASSFNSDLSGWNVFNVTSMADMFTRASSFNSDLSGWDVSWVTSMTGMFNEADSFNQNLGNWYVVLDNTSIAISSGAMKIGNIAAQNPIFDRQDITYEIGSGADSALFEIDGDALLIKPSANYSGKTEYAVNITSTGDFGVNNFRVINVTVTGAGDAGPS